MKMKKIDKITVALVIVVCVLAGVFMPTDIGVNVKINGTPNTVNQAVNTENKAETSAPQTTAPSTTAVAATENSGEENGDKADNSMPQSNEEVIKQYTLLVDKFKQQKPAYKKKEYQALPEEYRKFGSGVNTVLKVASGYMVSEEDAEELVRAAGAEEILNDVPIHGAEKGCTLTDYNAVEWAKCEDLGDGTYKLSFSLKEEKNAEPTPADTLIPVSAHGAVMQPMAFSDVKAEVDKVVGSVPGITVNQFELIYHECVFSCVYRPETDEVLSITHNIVIDIAADASVFGGTISGTARLINDMLIYDITW